MLRFIIHKVVLLIVVVVLLALIVFFLSKLAPGDRVYSYIDLEGITANENKTISDEDYRKIATDLNLNIPLFYFSIHPKVYPDTLYKNIFPSKRDSLQSVIFKKAKPSDLIPVIAWYGSNNQFHKWFGNVVKLNFGTSILDGQDVLMKIKGALKWTFIYILVAYFLTYGLAIPLGVFLAFYNKRKIAKLINIKLLIFYSMPLFWLATLSVIFFTSSEIAAVLNIFPSIGIGDIYEDMSIRQQLSIAIPHLVLPSIVVAIHSGAYVSTLIKNSMLKEMDKVYFVSLLARGLKRKDVVMKHVFPNSILPLITLIIVSFPASFAGSVVMEVIFNIPGMGRLLYDSILAYDWNVVFAIVLIIGIFTYLSYMAGDIIYSGFNPKIKTV